jgi:hypothetical protein
MSSPGLSTENSRATRPSCVRSASSARPAPGYWTLTATARPSCQTPRCTWPMLAAAAGLSSNDANAFRHSGSSSSASTRCTCATGNGGAESWSFVSAARYGFASSSGKAASNTLSAWPSFIAPPLSSPSTRKICSAVRCWSSLATISAGRPPMRLPRPSVARPATPRGSEASFAVRVTALRGMSATRPSSPARASRTPVTAHSGHTRNRALRAHPEPRTPGTPGTAHSAHAGTAHSGYTGLAHTRRA